MNEEELRQQKLAELRKQLQERQKAIEAEAKLNRIIGSLLSDAARTRLNNVRLVNKELYLKAVQAIIYLHNSGKLVERMSEEQLRNLLETLRSKREIKIRRK